MEINTFFNMFLCFNRFSFSTIMKFYAVAGLLAVLALHALAENNEVNSQSSGATPKTQAVANTKSPSDGYSTYTLSF